jgi:hypothetical protein
MDIDIVYYYKENTFFAECIFFPQIDSLYLSQYIHKSYVLKIRHSQFLK